MRILAVIALLSIVVAGVLTEIVLYSRNTLAVHHEWIGGKRLAATPIMGSAIDFRTRNYVHGNRLHLHEWHGFNEFLFTRLFHLGALRFRLRLGDDAYAIVEFNRNAETMSGIRLSRSRTFPSLSFRASADGRFLDRRPLDGLSLDGGWHDVELRFGADGARLAIDSRQVVRLPDVSQADRVVGFRAGHRAAVVDDVEISAADGQLLTREDFRNDRDAGPLAIGCLAAVLALAIVVHRLHRRNQRDPRRLLSATVSVQLAVLIALEMYLAFDVFVWSKRYYFIQTPQFVAASAQLNLVERMRWLVFTRFPFFQPDREPPVSRQPSEMMAFLKIAPPPEPYVAADLRIVRTDAGAPIEVVESDARSIRAYLERESPGAAIRILLLGTSQTWGVGAMRIDETVDVQLQRALSSSAGWTAPIVVINASLYGSRSAELLRRYRDHLHLFRPHLVVVNLSNNDSAWPIPARPTFAENLAGMVEQSTAIGASVLFALEANSRETPPHIVRKHAVMRGVAERLGVPQVDLHAEMNAPAVYDSGLLWWDQVHLTSYGQRRAAEILARAIMTSFMLTDGTPRVVPRSAAEPRTAAPRS